MTDDRELSADHCVIFLCSYCVRYSFVIVLCIYVFLLHVRIRYRLVFLCLHIKFSFACEYFRLFRVFRVYVLRL